MICICHRIQSLANMIYKEVMDTKEPEAMQAAEKLGPKGIHRILHDNKYGFGPSKTLESLLTGHPWNATLCHCIWSTLDATLSLRDELGKIHFKVLSKSLDFCRCLYVVEYSRLAILIVYVCQGCGHCPVFDFDWWVLKGATTGG